MREEVAMKINLPESRVQVSHWQQADDACHKNFFLLLFLLLAYYNNTVLFYS